MDAIIKRLQDALAVTAAVQDRHARMLVDHAAWLEAETRAVARHQEWLEEHEAAMRELDRKLDRIAELILRGRGGNGSE